MCDFIDVVQKHYGNTFSEIYQVDKNEYNNKLINNFGNNKTYWDKRVHLYKNGKINHVAHIDTLLTINKFKILVRKIKINNIKNKIN